MVYDMITRATDRGVTGMMTVHEVSRITGVSIRALHHYDEIGLLHPSQVTEAGYRLYDGKALERLQQILLFRELQFPLKEIAAILDSPDFDREKALDQQIALLTLRREHLDGLIALAREAKHKGGENMSCEAFDRKKIDEYAAQAKQSWGNTEAWREYEQKNGGRTREQEKALGDGLMQVLAGFQAMKSQPLDAPEVQAKVKELQDYITEHFYTCTPDILRGLGQMYGAGGEMTDNIDSFGGEGTAAYASEAIAAYCARK